MNKLEEYDPQKLQNNPWVSSLKIPVTKCTDWGKFVKKHVDDEAMPAEFWIERTQKGSMYYTPGVMRKLEKLSKNATHLLMYILTHLDRSKDYVQINHEHYMTRNKIKAWGTFTSARDELIEHEFIMRAKNYKTVFWLNPNYLLSGSRPDMYPDKKEQKGEWG